MSRTEADKECGTTRSPACAHRSNGPSLTSSSGTPPATAAIDAAAAAVQALVLQAEGMCTQAHAADVFAMAPIPYSQLWFLDASQTSCVTVK